MTHPYAVVIPSYQRPEGLVRKSLSTLLGGGVPRSAITVYLHAHDPHLPAYRDALDGMGVRARVTDRRGIGPQRQQIIEDYPAGTPVVSMDDDIKRVMRAVAPSGRDALVRLADLDGWFRQMFAAAEHEGLHVWGAAPVPNAFYMRHDRPYSTGLKLVMFNLYGFVNRPGHPVHAQTVKYKDEQELTLRAWWYDGGVVRSDDTAPVGEFYTPGGCQADGRHYEEVRASAEALIAQWPGYVRWNTKKKSDWPEVDLVRKPRGAGHPVDTPPPGVSA